MTTIPLWIFVIRINSSLFFPFILPWGFFENENESFLKYDNCCEGNYLGISFFNFLRNIFPRWIVSFENMFALIFIKLEKFIIEWNYISVFPFAFLWFVLYFSVILSSCLVHRNYMSCVVREPPLSISHRL